jgi:peptidoglycan/xylan/chitin deacetylase (PgdA/CDA1 family)
LKALALKVDVDTLMGLREGVPPLLDLFRDLGVTASFFVAMGPDNSGKAIRRLFTRRGFLQKMLRTGAPRLYGWKTMLYGTLWPAPPIAASAPQVLRAIAAAGHELGLHAYDHVHWHDHLLTLSPAAVQREVLLAQREFVAILGYPAVSFAAPGWQCSAASRQVLDSEGFLYASDTRGVCPYFPRFNSQTSAILEIPTTCPTLDEYVGRHGRTAELFFKHISLLADKNAVHVLTVHAEAEGRLFLPEFRSFLQGLLHRRVRLLPLQVYARELLAQPQPLPVSPVFQGLIPGRAGEVSCQGPLEEAA